MKKILLNFIIIMCIITITGCTSKKENIGKIDEVNKPVPEGEIDLNSFFQWYDVKDKFEKSKQEAESIIASKNEFSTEEKNEYVNVIKNLIPQFLEGATIYQVKDACELYKSSLILSSTSSDSKDPYFRIGMFSEAAILSMYGGYNDKEFDPYSTWMNVNKVIKEL